MTEMTWPAQITETLSLKRTRRFCTSNQSTTPSSLPRHQLYNHARSRRFPHHGQGCQAHRPREHHCPRRRRPRVSTSPPISSPEKKVSTIGGTSRYAGARDASPSPHVARSRNSIRDTDHRIAPPSFLHLRGVGRRAAAAGFLALILSTNAAPAEAETKRRAAVPEKKALSPYGYSGSGFGKYKAPRAFLKDEKAEVLKAYGLDTLPGQ